MTQELKPPNAAGEAPGTLSADRRDRAMPAPVRPSAKRDAIVRAALQVFVREGYAASVDQVAAEAGVSKQTVYAHFGSKERLFRACVEETKRDIQDDLATAPDMETGLRRFAAALLARAVSPDSIAFQRLLVSQVAAFPEAARIYDEAGPARARRQLTAFLAQRVAAGELRPDEPERLTEDFYALLLGTRRLRLILGLEDPPDSGEIERHAGRAVAVFLRAHGA